MAKNTEADGAAVQTAELRELLARTGKLFTQESDDVGHLSERWRSEILALLDAVDGGAPLGAQDPGVPEDEAARLLASVRNVLVGDIEAKFTRAVFLISDALPVMQALNNARSEKWLPVAEAFLADGSVVRF